MKLLIINQFFYPDKSATSQLLTELAEDLSAGGIEVTVLCSQAGYLGEKNPPEEEYKRIRIIRLPSARFGKNIRARLLSYASFYLAVLAAVTRSADFDVILVVTTPPLIAVVPAVFKLIRSARVIYVVQDLYPDIAVALGSVRSTSVAALFLERVSRFCLRRADSIVAIGDCMKEQLLRKGISPERIVVIPNWSDSKRIVPIAKSNNDFLRINDLEGKFVLLYSGNMGRAHEFETLLQAAVRLRDLEHIQFVFVGDGAERSRIESVRQEYQLSNITLLPYVEQDQLSHSLSAADICLVTQKSETRGLMVPSKIYGIMAAGRPMLYIGPSDSEAAQSIRQHSCGVVVSNSNPEELASLIQCLVERKDLLRTMGENARKALRTHFDRELMTRKYLQVMSKGSLTATARSVTVGDV